MPRRLLLVAALAKQSDGWAKPILLLCGVASAAFVVLAIAPEASAHAIPLHAEPPNGSILLTAPRYVSVTFDSTVRVGPRNAAIRNDGTNVLDGTPRIAPGNRLVIPLRSGLADGDYTVRWSIVSDDGHEQEGVIVFGLGRTAAQPTAALTTHGFVTWQRVLMRTLFLLGVLGAAGAAVLLAGRARRRPAAAPGAPALRLLPARVRGRRRADPRDERKRDAIRALHDRRRRSPPESVRLPLRSRRSKRGCATSCGRLRRRCSSAPRSRAMRSTTTSPP